MDDPLRCRPESRRLRYPQHASFRTSSLSTMIIQVSKNNPDAKRLFANPHLPLLVTNGIEPTITKIA